MKQYPERMPPLIIVQVEYIETLPQRMPQYEPNRWRSEKEIHELNKNRQGSLLDFIEDFVDTFPSVVDDCEKLLTENRIWKQRTVNIGTVNKDLARKLGFTGPMLRASGIDWDLKTPTLCGL